MQIIPGFVLSIASPPLSRDRGIKMKKSINQNHTLIALALLRQSKRLTRSEAHLRGLAPGAKKLRRNVVAVARR